MGGFKKLILWIEGTEDNNNLDIYWSTAYVGGFKGLILWTEGTEDKKNLDIIEQLLMWEALKDLYYGLKVLRTKMTGYKLINCFCGSF